MDSLQIAKSVHDSLMVAARYSSEMAHLEQSSETYKWIIGLGSGFFILFLSFALTSVASKFKEFSSAITLLTSEIGKLSTSIEVNRAEEVAHRGFCVEKHSKHAEAISELQEATDNINNRVIVLEADHKRLHG